MQYNPSEILKAMGDKDLVTYRHSLCVGRLLKEFSKFLGHKDEISELLYEAGCLHDVGKLYIPDKILKKAGKLTDKEFSVIKSHAQMGYNYLKKLGAPAIVQEVALGHHLLFSGGGYPFPEKKEQELSLYVRMTTIVDVFEALTAKRPYKEPLTREQAFQIMEANPKNYDPVLFEEFKRFTRESRGQ